MGRGESSTSLAPGFRFHPTDEELLRYYLKRKVTNKPFRFEPISVVDVYKSEPWDLPAKSKLKTRDLEWYFFTVLDRKYSNGAKTNRATDRGYWKTTGKDRAIHCNSRVVGMKKTLVYHIGRAPKGQRTNWVMHEYRLEDQDLVAAGVSQDAFVLCRIFQKSGTGPKNGEQYGAPFVEEEWDDDELDLAPLPGEQMVAAEEVAIADDAYADANDLEQNFGAGIVSENSPLPLNFYHGETSNHAEHPRSFSEDDNKPIIDSGENHFGSDQTDEQNFLPLPGQYEMDVTSGHNGYLAEPSNNVNDFGINSYVIDEPYLDVTDNPPVEEGLYLEAKDLFNAVESDSAGDSNGFDVDEYLSFFDAEDANLTFDPSEIMGSDDVSAQLPQEQMDVNGGTEDVALEQQKLFETHGNTEASSSMQKPEAEKLQSDIKYPFLKQASHMLGGMHAPPAFASEFPTKDAAIRLNSAQSSSSIHVTAAMIRIENMTFGGTGVDLSFGKDQNVNIILSLNLSQGSTNPPSLVPTANIFSGKAGSAFSSNWFFMFFWVLILSVSYRIGTFICAK